MAKLNYFNNASISKEKRADIAFNVLNGVREMIGLALKRGQMPSYAASLLLLKDFAPEIGNEIDELLQQHTEPKDVKYTRQMAKQKGLHPLEYIDIQINEHHEVLKHEYRQSEISEIERKLLSLHKIREYFLHRNISLEEGTALSRDYNKVMREHIFEKDEETDRYVQYKLPSGNKLRIKLYHPTRPEFVLGSDLTYEVYDTNTALMRFVHLQYKTFDRGKLYFSRTGLRGQMDRLHQNFCQRGYCRAIKKNNAVKYRLPFCSAFLRPTDKIQLNNIKLNTTGVHIPVCSAFELADKQTHLSSKDCYSHGVSNRIFEEMFCNGHLGSGWMSIDKVRKAYNALRLSDYGPPKTFHLVGTEIIPLPKGSKKFYIERLDL